MDERRPNQGEGPYASRALRCYAWVSVLSLALGTAWMLGAFREPGRLHAVPASAARAVVRRAPEPVPIRPAQAESPRRTGR